MTGTYFGILVLAILLNIIIAIALYTYVPKIISYINKKKHPFFGKIETYEDVNAFIAHKELLSFQNTDKNNNIYQYSVVNTTLYRMAYNSDCDCKTTIDIPPDVYKYPIGTESWYDKSNRLNIPIRAFIWENKDIINKQLAIDYEIEQEIKEKELKEKEQLLQLKKLDEIIRKSN